MSERWLPIPGFEGRYEVSDLGRVKSLGRTETFTSNLTSGARGNVTRTKREKMLRASPCPNGYLTVRLLGKTFTVHSLVLHAFVGPRPNGFAACHGDADKQNNRLTNLRWDSYTANNYERRMVPLERTNGKFVKRGAA